MGLTSALSTAVVVLAMGAPPATAPATRPAEAPPRPTDLGIHVQTDTGYRMSLFDASYEASVSASPLGRRYDLTLGWMITAPDEAYHLVLDAGLTRALDAQGRNLVTAAGLPTGDRRQAEVAKKRTAIWSRRQFRRFDLGRLRETPSVVLRDVKGHLPVIEAEQLERVELPAATEGAAVQIGPGTVARVTRISQNHPTQTRVEYEYRLPVATEASLLPSAHIVSVEATDEAGRAMSIGGSFDSRRDSQVEDGTEIIRGSFLVSSRQQGRPPPPEDPARHRRPRPDRARSALHNRQDHPATHPGPAAAVVQPPDRLTPPQARQGSPCHPRARRRERHGTTSPTTPPPHPAPRHANPGRASPALLAWRPA